MLHLGCRHGVGCGLALVSPHPAQPRRRRRRVRVAVGDRQVAHFFCRQPPLHPRYRVCLTHRNALRLSHQLAPAVPRRPLHVGLAARSDAAGRPPAGRCELHRNCGSLSRRLATEHLRHGDRPGSGDVFHHGWTWFTVRSLPGAVDGHGHGAEPSPSRSNAGCHRRHRAGQSPPA